MDLVSSEGTLMCNWNKDTPNGPHKLDEYIEELKLFLVIILDTFKTGVIKTRTGTTAKAPQRT